VAVAAVGVAAALSTAASAAPELEPDLLVSVPLGWGLLRSPYPEKLAQLEGWGWCGQGAITKRHTTRDATLVAWRSVLLHMQRL